MKSNTEFYGTKEYLEAYWKDYYQHINIVKLVSGETIIGFVYDDLYKNKTQVGYPLQIMKINSHQFQFAPWVPPLETDCVTIADSCIMSVSAPSESTNKVYMSAIVQQFVTIKPEELSPTVH